MSRLVSKKQAVFLKTQLNKSFLARSVVWDLKKRGLIDDRLFNDVLYSINAGRKTSLKRLKREYNKNRKKDIDI